MDTYKLLFIDMITLLKDEIESIKKESTDSDFDAGLRLGFYYAFSTIKNTAISFQIPLEDIGLADFNLEQYL